MNLSLRKIDGALLRAKIVPPSEFISQSAKPSGVKKKRRSVVSGSGGDHPI